MIGGAPLGATTIAGALLAGAGSGNQNLAPAAVSVSWTIPAQSVTTTGASVLAPAAVTATWTIPTQAVTVAGSLAAPTATATWTVPTQAVTASGSAAIAPAAVVATWVVPSQSFIGGIQGSPTAADVYRRYLVNISADKAVAITKSDTVNIPGPDNRLTCDTIYCGGAGVVRVVFQDGSTADYTVTAGTTLFVNAKRVNSTGTDATLLIAQYQI